MKTLAFDFSSSRRTVALFADGDCRAVEFTEDRKAGVFALTEAVLGAADVSREEIGEIVLGLGPGSYTGIRQSIAIAQGWQLGTGIELRGVSSVRAIGETLRRQGVRGEVAVLVDAQRGEFYCEQFKLTDDELCTVVDLRIIDQEFVDNMPDAIGLFGSDVLQKRVARLEAVHPDPAALVSLARESSPLSGEKLEPIYLRETAFKKALPTRFS
jgi:tRNA threonylcarbamoyladenosine biosynthesis protein TsaB